MFGEYRDSIHHPSYHDQQQTGLQGNDNPSVGCSIDIDNTFGFLLVGNENPHVESEAGLGMV